jgi:cytidylate kinase
MTPNTIIAIDGPAGSGKSTLGKRLADQLGYLYFDTGVMYRAVTCAALNRQVDLNNESAVTEIANLVEIDVRPASKDDGRDNDLVADGRDITWEIRTPAVDQSVSVVAAYPGVRAALTEQQRRIGHKGRVVMVGRDIGTVVLPEAGLKVYLDASVEERARRRYDERISRDEEVDYDEILNDMRRRDGIDSNREVAPLKPADDAILLDSDHLDQDQVLEKVAGLVKEHSK